MAPHQAEEVDSRPEFPGKRTRQALLIFGNATLPVILAILAYRAYAFALVNLPPIPTIVDMVWEGLKHHELHIIDNWHQGVFALVCGMLLPCVLFMAWRLSRPGSRPVYLMDFSVLKPADELKVPNCDFIRRSQNFAKFNDESMKFQTRLLDRSGLGEETYLPPSLVTDNPQINMNTAREEAELVMYTVVQDVLDRTGVKPKDIGILIVNCSLFNPTPSLSAMIINKFKMRSDIHSYNLAGMGCSAGVIAIDLARELLQVYPNKYALVVSTENITQNWYFGNNRSMLIPNVLFRLGGAGILLTNKPGKRSRSKYQLQHVVRVHLGADDQAYRCVFQKPDEDGTVGVELRKDLLKVATASLVMNMTRLGPLVLPVSEKIFFVLNLIAKSLIGKGVKTYTPDFKRAFDHFCLHAGGRAVIEGLAAQLQLPKEKAAPNGSTLQWYGNTSSSTIWYSLAYIETLQKVKRGETVWQVGFGSGFKCNSAVWKSLRTIKEPHAAWRHLLKTDAATC